MEEHGIDIGSPGLPVQSVITGPQIPVFVSEFSLHLYTANLWNCQANSQFAQPELNNIYHRFSAHFSPLKSQEPWNIISRQEYFSFVTFYNKKCKKNNQGISGWKNSEFKNKSEHSTSVQHKILSSKHFKDIFSTHLIVYICIACWTSLL